MTTNDEQYVPNEGDVRSRYVLAGLPDRATSDQISRARDREVPEFDRFLARVRRDAAREALDGYADTLNLNGSAAVWAWPDFVDDIRDWVSTRYPETED